MFGVVFEDLCIRLLISQGYCSNENFLNVFFASPPPLLARQAVKNPSRRLPGMIVRSPAGSTSPGTDYALGDLSQPSIEEASPGVRFGPSEYVAF